MTYDEGSEIKIIRPDFVFFAKLPDGTIAADILDPHGTQFGDTLPKLKGLCRYAEANDGIYRRIDAIAQVDGKYRVLDLTEASVRSAVGSAASVVDLYRSDAAADYAPG